MNLTNRVVQLVAVAVLAAALSPPSTAAAAEAMPEISGPRDAVASSPSARNAVARKLSKPTHWHFLTNDGRPVERVERNGEQRFQLVVGKTYKVRGRLDRTLREDLADTSLMLQRKADDVGEWTPVVPLRAKRDGRLRARFEVPMSYFGKHTYRLVSSNDPGSETVTLGSTLPAVADSSFVLALTNNANRDLEFTFPTAQNPTTGEYVGGQVTVLNDETATLTYVNPITDVTTVGFYAQRTSCVLGCAKYNSNWDHTPNKRKYTPCSTAPPTFSSGSTHTIRVTPQLTTSGFDMFVLDEFGNVLCTGSLDTSFSEWIGDNPVLKWYYIYLEFDAAVNAVAMIVMGGLVLVDAIPEAIAEDWVRELRIKKAAQDVALQLLFQF